MGAELQSRTYNNWTEAKENWRMDQDQAASEDGNCYSGNINMLDGFPSAPTKVESGAEAVELLEGHDKYEAPVAIELPDGKIVIGGWCSS